MKQYIGLDKMDYTNIQKIIIAPQIVVYRNIFKHSKEIIEMLNDDNEGSLFSPLRDWYKQGKRKDVQYHKNTVTHESDSEYVKIEKKYLKEISDITDFINKDYFGDFEKEKGIWPNFIIDWEKLKKPEDYYVVDFFRYIIENKLKENPETGSYLMMGYHVDEFPIKGEIKNNRHVLTLNFYLNDDYSEGEIYAYDSISDKNYKYKPLPGDVVVMPSTAPFYHGVGSYNNADRYFMRTFVNYDSPGEWTDNYHLESNETNEDDYIKNHRQQIKISSTTYTVLSDGTIDV